MPDHVLIKDRWPTGSSLSSDRRTIDGEDAKDLDDAVTLTKENGIYHLGVHCRLAIVYKGGSALDREALKRGNQCISQVQTARNSHAPVRLSNGICSLNQGRIVLL